MAEKVVKVPLNRNVKPETFERVKDLAVEMGESEGAVIDRVVAAFGASPVLSESAAASSREWDEVRAYMANLPERLYPILLRAMADFKAQSAAKRGGSVDIPAVVAQVKTNSDWFPCNHCGNGGRIPPERGNAWASCAECVKDGHNDFQTCQRCMAIQYQKDQAAKSTSCDPTGIEFKADWGP